MNTSIGSTSNFVVDTVVLKKKVKTYQSIGFTVSSLSSTSVSLTLSSTQKFANGGQIILKATPTGGLESSFNIPLNKGNNLTYSISGRGMVITPQ
jgi:hypothetical protein